MTLSINEFLAGSFGVLAKTVGIWFTFWVIRRGGEFDYDLDRTAQVVRWFIVMTAFGLAAAFPRGTSTLPRIVGLVVGLSFLCWPNFAYYFTRLLRHGRLLPTPRDG